METKDLSAMIQKIVQNPDFAGMVNELRGDGEKKSTEDISGEVMAHLPDVLAMFGQSGGDSREKSSGKEPKEKETEKTPEKREEQPKTEKSAVLPFGIAKKYDKAKAEKLLYAIKPYRSTSRCEIIDKCVSVMQLTDVMGALQGLDGLMKPKGGD